MEEEQNQQTLEQRLNEIQEKWTDKISELNDLMKNMANLDSLLNKIYAERQNLVDYYTNIRMTMSKLSRQYIIKSAEYYNKLKMGENGLRYTNESAINNQIEAALIDFHTPIQLLSIHIDFIKETLVTINNMIFGINNKIRVYELVNDVK